jgi:hypothetical protein
MTTWSPALSPISLPSTMPPLNNANMNVLPLELKQRICSFLTPKDLKPLRLTSRIFATAAERYLIDRFILFNHIDSIVALDQVVNHETFGRRLTTLVCDNSVLNAQNMYSIGRGHRHISPLPSWDDYRPKTTVLRPKESCNVHMMSTDLPAKNGRRGRSIDELVGAGINRWHTIRKAIVII